MSDQRPQGEALVRDFANSIDIDEGTDAFADADGLARWLLERALLDAGVPVGEDDLALARSLREALRDILRAHHDGEPDPAKLARLDAISARLPLRLVFDASGDPGLMPAAEGVPGALAEILAAVAIARAEDQWERLKICPADDCQWVFYDRSKNRSRRWCAMRVCGNREKTRAYRQRQTSG